jgi:hypothetical protein
VHRAATEDDDAVFAESVNYAADEAYGRITGDDHAFHDAWEARQRRADAEVHDGGAAAEPDLGEEFDFDDDDEMRRRLPRLAALFLDRDE